MTRVMNVTYIVKLLIYSVNYNIYISYSRLTQVEENICRCNAHTKVTVKLNSKHLVKLGVES